MPQPARPILLAILLALLAGCQATTIPISLGPPYTPIEHARAIELMPLPIPPGIVRVTDNQGKQHDQPDTTVPLTLEDFPGEHPGEHPRLLSRTLPGTLPPGTLPGALPGALPAWRMQVANFWIVDLIREPTGTVSILSETELIDARRVEYDPPMPMLPATLTMNQPSKHTSRVRIYNHDTGTLLSTGECTAVITLLGTKQISTPLGPATATLIQTQRQYKLPLVRVDMHILSAYVPAQGPIAGLTRRNIKLLGLLPISREERMMRVK